MIISVADIAKYGLSALCFLVIAFIFFKGFKENTKQHKGSGTTEGGSTQSTETKKSE